MTLVTFAPVGNGTTTPRGYIEGRPVGFGTLPDSFRAVLVDGEVEVDLDPTTVDWVWNIIERVDYGRDEYVTVDDEVGPVTYDSLTKVNGDDFSPTVAPSAGWQAALDAEETARAAADALKVDTATYTTGLAGKQPLASLLTDLAGLTLADGQVVQWNNTTGHLVAATPSGAQELASATNITGTTTNISAAGGVGTSVVIPSTTIVVPNSGGRSVSLRFNASFTQTVAGQGTLWVMIWEGVSFKYAAKVPLTNSTNAALAAVTTGVNEFDIGVVTTSRTFHLQALLYAPAANNPAGTITNLPNDPSVLKALAF